MFEALKNWWNERFGDEPSSEPNRVHANRRASDSRGRRRSDNPENIDKPGDEKNVLIRNKYVREETGTHETLKILDDSLVDSGEETGIDPYNTGGFDRSRNWESRFRK